MLKNKNDVFFIIQDNHKKLGSYTMTCFFAGLHFDYETTKATLDPEIFVCDDNSCTAELETMTNNVKGKAFTRFYVRTIESNCKNHNVYPIGHHITTFKSPVDAILYWNQRSCFNHKWLDKYNYPKIPFLNIRGMELDELTKMTLNYKKEFSKLLYGIHKNNISVSTYEYRLILAAVRWLKFIEKGITALKISEETIKKPRFEEDSINSEA